MIVCITGFHLGGHTLGALLKVESKSPIKDPMDGLFDDRPHDALFDWPLALRLAQAIHETAVVVALNAAGFSPAEPEPAP